MFLKNKNIIFKIRRPKVTDYAALNFDCSRGLAVNGKFDYCAFGSESVKLPFVIRIFVLSIFSGLFTQVLLATCICWHW